MDILCDTRPCDTMPLCNHCIGTLHQTSSAAGKVSLSRDILDVTFLQILQKTFLRSLTQQDATKAKIEYRDHVQLDNSNFDSRA